MNWKVKMKKLLLYFHFCLTFFPPRVKITTENERIFVMCTIARFKLQFFHFFLSAVFLWFDFVLDASSTDFNVQLIKSNFMFNVRIIFLSIFFVTFASASWCAHTIDREMLQHMSLLLVSMSSAMKSMKQTRKPNAKRENQHEFVSCNGVAHRHLLIRPFAQMFDSLPFFFFPRNLIFIFR